MIHTYRSREKERERENGIGRKIRIFMYVNIYAYLYTWKKTYVPNHIYTHRERYKKRVCYLKWMKKKKNKKIWTDR